MRTPEEKPARKGESPAPPEVTTSLVLIAYVLALLCAVAPLAILGAGFAGAVLFQRGRRAAGAGVVVLAVACAAIGVTALR
jgi:hypothetical protein